MLYIEVKDFNCKKCGSKEYAVVSLEPIEIICDNCGEEYQGEYNVEDEESIMLLHFISLLNLRLIGSRLKD